MKKQVTFAESRTVHRLHQDRALHRCAGMDESQPDVSLNFSNDSDIFRPPAERSELQPETTVQIPKTTTAAPFLKHAALTPGQKAYLYTIAASYSPAHVRSLITQHYMNVLHRCIRTGCSPQSDDLDATSVSLPVSDKTEKDKHPSKHKGKRNTSAKNPGKSSLPKIPNRRSSVQTKKETHIVVITHTEEEKSSRSKDQPGGGGGGGGGGRGGGRTGRLSE